MTPAFKILKFKGNRVIINLNNVTEIRESSDGNSICVFFGNEDTSDFAITMDDLRSQLPDSLFL